jgi:ornithine cyclodeaminase/alanine dehydrogenase-like protein (mu-crystallin family)
MTLIISNRDVEQLLSMPECIEVLEEAYVELANGTGVTRTRSEIWTPTERPDAQYALKSVDGVIPKFGVGAVRITSDILTWPKEGNMRRVNTPSAPGNRYVGLVLLFSTANSEPLAILQDGVMGRMRVGATNGLGVKYLARKDARTIGLLGSGWQASGQLAAACAMRSIERVKCFSPNKERRTAFAQEMSRTLGVEVVPADSADAAMKDVDIALCSTNTIDPIFFERWVRPGLHFSSIKEEEIETAALRRADKVVAHTNSEPPMNVRSKGLHVPQRTSESGKPKEKVDLRGFATLAAVIAGHAPGRQSDEETTCLVNAQGTGYQFAAAGSLVYRKAKQQGLGRELPTEWFTEDVPN